MKISLSDKLIAWLTLLSGLSISAVAVWYSVAGLISIFAAAVIPIAIMGTVLELSKLVATVWLKQNWFIAPKLMRAYLLSAITILMIITSMGIFGFLSKAHMDQNLVSGDVQSKVSIYDEKIKVARENIDANRKGLKQLDEAVDQVMGRSTDEKGADKAVALRRSQSKERARLIADIEAEQKKISQLNEERAPIAAEVRKVEAEVGPIKYIAALIYGDNPDTNLLERAVRWVIIVIVIVFDPLAVVMLLASQYSFAWFRQQRELVEPNLDPSPELVESNPPEPQPETEKEPKFDFSKHAYLNRPWVWRVPGEEPVGPMVYRPETEVPNSIDEPEIDTDKAEQKEAIRRWKEENPTGSVKEQRKLFNLGQIAQLPWTKFLRKSEMSGFGTDFPKEPTKGQFFVKIDTRPSALYKFNGTEWIKVDKNLTDEYAFDNKYIEFLINAIADGTYDLELLTDSEKEQINIALTNSKA